MLLVGFAALSPLLPSVKPRSRTFSVRCSAVSKKNVLVVNTDGGGHGIIGPHLAEALLTEGHSVAVRQAGVEGASPPCERYGLLASAYPTEFTLSYGVADSSTVPTGVFDAIYDNCSKKPGDANAVLDAAREGTELFYVSSAGAYSYDSNFAPHMSGDAAKGPTIDVEEEMRLASVSSACFRPIYIIGPHSSKREYSDFFFDRIVRGRPVPVPGHPSNLVSISDVRDVAAMMACALGKGFRGLVFNSVAPRAITVQGIVNMCSKAVGVPTPDIVSYDPSEISRAIEGFAVKKAFPYRPRHFYAEPSLDPVSDRVLNWNPSWSSTEEQLSSAFEGAFAEYVERGLKEAPVDFSLDDKILEAVSRVASF